MVTVIKHGRSLSRILRYNELKVETGHARIIGNANCPFDAAVIPVLAKLNFLERMASLNTKVTHPSVHISLNFPPSESGLSDARMNEIATAYMEHIGFAGQPWMVYRHTDAGHPHLHIVTLKVRPDGARIDMHNMGRNQSETARRQVEKQFGLTPAEKPALELPYTPGPVSSQRLQYGKVPTKKAISSVLRFVLENYRFTSLGELNAILTGYNLRADRGKVTSRTFVNGGLLYRILDTAGKPVGVPVKASDFHFSATLKKLEVHYQRNEDITPDPRPQLRLAIERAIEKNKPASITALRAVLTPLGIDLVLHRAAGGSVHGATWVDHRNHNSFNGSSLGKPYSAKGLLERFPEGPQEAAAQHPAAGLGQQHLARGGAADKTALVSTGSNNALNLPEILLEPSRAAEYLASGGKRKKKKKRKGRN